MSRRLMVNRDDLGSLDAARYRAAFEWDGALRDIWVANTGLGDWQQLLDYPHDRPFVSAIDIDGAVAPLPASASELFPPDDADLLFFSFARDGWVLTCLPFVDEMELVRDPREIDLATNLASLLRFMRDICLLFGKEVCPSWEDDRVHSVIRFVPKSDDWPRPIG